MVNDSEELNDAGVAEIEWRCAAVDAGEAARQEFRAGLTEPLDPDEL